MALDLLLRLGRRVEQPQALATLVQATRGHPPAQAPALQHHCRWGSRLVGQAQAATSPPCASQQQAKSQAWSTSTSHAIQLGREDLAGVATSSCNGGGDCSTGTQPLPPLLWLQPSPLSAASLPVGESLQGASAPQHQKLPGWWQQQVRMQQLSRLVGPASAQASPLLAGPATAPAYPVLRSLAQHPHRASYSHSHPVLLTLTQHGPLGFGHCWEPVASHATHVWQQARAAASKCALGGG